MTLELSMKIVYVNFDIHSLDIFFFLKNHNTFLLFLSGFVTRNKSYHDCVLVSLR